MAVAALEEVGSLGGGRLAAVANAFDGHQRLGQREHMKMLLWILAVIWWITWDAVFDDGEHFIIEFLHPLQVQKNLNVLEQIN